jgi:hypothetical protein
MPVDNQIVQCGNTPVEIVSSICLPVTNCLDGGGLPIPIDVHIVNAATDCVPIKNCVDEGGTPIPIEVTTGSLTAEVTLNRYIVGENPAPPNGTVADSLRVKMCSRMPRVVHLPLQQIPAILFTNQTPFPIPEGICKLTAYITCVPSILGNRAQFQVLWGNGFEEARETIAETTLAIVQPDARQQFFELELNGPILVALTPQIFSLVFEVPPGALTFRLTASEIGTAIGDDAMYMQITLTGAT